MRKHRDIVTIARFLPVAFSIALLLSSCSEVPAQVEAQHPATAPTVVHAEPLKEQIRSLSEHGFGLHLDEFVLDLPAKHESHRNVLDLSGGDLSLKLDALSLHSLQVSLDADIDYNGVERDFSLSLSDDRLHFALGDAGDEGVDYNLRYKTSLASYDLGEIDATTRGISYYEYGDLDYVLSEILSTLGKDSLFPLSNASDKLSVDWDAILDSMEGISEYDSSRYLWELPIGETTYRVGLCHDADYLLSGIEFPLADPGHESVSFDNGMELKIRASLSDLAEPSFAPKYPENTYTEIVDSLSLFRRVASYVNQKRFGFAADFTLSHTEDAIVGDEERFSKDPVSESLNLSAEAMLDLSSGSFEGIHASASFSQGETSQTLSLHAEETPEEDGLDIYLALNDAVKLKTSTGVAGALLSSTKDALADESIQNDAIMTLLSSLTSTANGVSQAIDTFKQSALYEDVENGHYEDVLGTITSIESSANALRLTLDLSASSLHGEAEVLLSGDPSHSLAKVLLHDVGIVSGNDQHTTFLLNGSLELIDYVATPLTDSESYMELTHIPHWTETIQSIAEYDQLSASIEGYLLTEGTHSPVTASAWYGFGNNYQGFAFRGEIAFDLAARVGTGEMTFVDRKEDYVNDHVLQVDVTGEEGENDTDENDLKGTGNTNAMYVKYSSVNVTATEGSNAYDNEKRAEPVNADKPLFGRFSIHSLNGILDVLSNFSAEDARLERLSNLFSLTSGSTILSQVLNGHYFDLLSHEILSEAEVTPSRSRFVIAPGLLSEESGLTLTLDYDVNGKPTAITVDTKLGEKLLHVTITLGETHFEAFPFRLSHNDSSYTDFSSVKTLVEYVRDTISLGGTDAAYDAMGNLLQEKDTTTTYHIGGSAAISIGKLDAVTVPLDLFIYLKGSTLMILGTTHTPNIAVATDGEAGTTFCYISEGDAKEGTVYIRKEYVTHGFLGFGRKGYTVSCRVKGGDFLDNIGMWILDYILNLGDVVTNEIKKDDKTKKALHGEDLITKFVVADSNKANPAWSLGLDVGKLANTSLLGVLDATIYGLTAHYSDAYKSYDKQTLYRLSGSLPLLTIFSVNLDLSFKNILTNQNNRYVNAWTADATAYAYTRSGTTISKTSLQTAQAIWNGSYGVASMSSAAWKVAP